MNHYPKLTVWVGQDSFPASQEDGRFPKENAPVPRKVNQKSKMRLQLHP
ncbi:neuronal regeneration-related protein-like [Petaurus breviceps papuanus]